MGTDNTYNNTGGFGDAIQRTDKRYRGEELGKDLIGEDIPEDVQRWEEMSEDEREDALRRGEKAPKGFQR
ncbi:hypothetical protein DYI37_11260 [Fulvimarina endophytica]|uniref:Uncharacterized protein n=1 Tax=Fulvimarina endophytica TaxID=2293836 RepID=A0A371X2X5_9HYPH|nr:hypothetical protein [Fulvimarina endophytica]RFC63581.1 hypothetical protein DYI37_11260 [Fulvimarina endophytica]